MLVGSGIKGGKSSEKEIDNHQTENDYLSILSFLFLF
jgi:hypothetical protein